MTPDAVRIAFVALQGLAFRLPDSYKSAAGLDEGVVMYASILAEITPAELMAAVQSWGGQSEPWWPTPGQLLDRVPGMDEAREVWNMVLRNDDPGILSGIVKADLGDVDDPEGILFRRAYRELGRRWLAIPREERTSLVRTKKGVRIELSAELTDRPLLEGPALVLRLEGATHGR